MLLNTNNTADHLLIPFESLIKMHLLIYLVIFENLAPPGRQFMKFVQIEVKAKVESHIMTTSEKSFWTFWGHLDN